MGASPVASSKKVTRRFEGTQKSIALAGFVVSNYRTCANRVKGGVQLLQSTFPSANASGKTSRNRASFSSVMLRDLPFIVGLLVYCRFWRG
ncbi:MAG: hypothetical protein OXU50_01725, partial [Gammaproteobacteria bacterium]|nr:hypothetical protein [Gammaproteobacteria bacterium]